MVLCGTVDRLSLDVEHSSKILKNLNYHDTAIWTVQAGQPISNMELHMRSTLSYELVGKIRYRTPEGMKTAVRKGKATTRLCYGYRLGQQRDANGDRIGDLREIGPAEAGIVRWIFEHYANVVSPVAFAQSLNVRGVPAPQHKYWRDDTIRGDGKRRGRRTRHGAETQKAPRGLRRGAFEEVSRVGEFTSLSGCGGRI